MIQIKVIRYYKSNKCDSCKADKKNVLPDQRSGHPIRVYQSKIISKIKIIVKSLQTVVLIKKA